MSYATRKREILLLLLFISAILSILFASLVFSVGIAVKGSYALIGVTIVIFIQVFSDAEERSDLDEWNSASQPEPLRYSKILTSIFCISLVVALFTDGNLFALLSFSLVGYWTLVTQIINDRLSVPHVLYQTTLLGAMMPIYKYFATGFYFGKGDITGHVQSVERVIAEGRASAILDSYQPFPGYHFLIGNISLVYDITPYESLMIVGVLAYLSLLLLAYRLSVTLSLTREVSVLVVLALSALSPIAYNATYFIPKSAGLIYCAFILYSLLKGVRCHRSSYFLIAIVIGVNLAFTHHLSVVLFSLALIPAFGTRFIATRFSRQFNRGVLPKPSHLLVLLSILLTHWILIGPGFIWGLGNILPVIFRRITTGLSFASTASKSTSSLVNFGTTVPDPSVSDLALWIVSPDGVYNTLLLAIFLLGLFYFYSRRYQHTIAFPLVSAGFLGMAILLKTPFSLKSLARMRKGWAVYSALAIGFGLYRLSKSYVSSTSLKQSLVISLFVLFILSGQIAAANDVYQVRPDVSDQVLLEHDFEEKEYKQLQKVGYFASQHDSQTSTFWATRILIDRFIAVKTGVNDASTAPIVRPDSITAPEGLFIYRKGWTDSRVSYQSGGLNQGTFIMSEKWLKYSIDRGNKVYTTGSVGMLWQQRNRTYLGTNSSQNRTGFREHQKI